MRKNQRKPESKLSLDNRTSIEDLVVGDIVHLELKIFRLNLFTRNDGCYAVFEGVVDGTYSFLDLDGYIKDKRSKDQKEIQQIRAQRDDIDFRGTVYITHYVVKQLQPWHVEGKERENKLKLLDLGCRLLRKAYTFDKVVYVNEYNQVQRVEKDKSLI